MPKAVFKCESCMFESTRRWNINRHIKTVHDGNALAFNNKSGKISSQPSSSLVPIWRALIPFPYGSSIYGYEQEFAGIEFDLKSGMTKEGKAMMSIYEELSKKINALEDLVSSNQINQNQISAFLIYSLLTENPIHTLDEIILIKRFKRAKQKIISHASRIIKGDPLLVDGLVSTLIQSTPYYKDMFQFQANRKNSW